MIHSLDALVTTEAGYMNHTGHASHAHEQGCYESQRVWVIHMSKAAMSHHSACWSFT